jgi:hypothetical protein
MAPLPAEMLGARQSNSCGLALDQTFDGRHHACGGAPPPRVCGSTARIKLSHLTSRRRCVAQFGRSLGTAVPFRFAGWQGVALLLVRMWRLPISVPQAHSLGMSAETARKSACATGVVETAWKLSSLQRVYY